MATIYLYENKTNTFVGSVTGGYEALVINVPEHCDFTLTRPPDIYEPHKWNGLEWVKVETET